MYRKLTFLLAVVVLLGLVSNAWAVTCTWTNAGPDVLWSTPENWDTGFPPGPSYTARIDPPYQGPVIDSDVGTVWAIEGPRYDSDDDQDMYVIQNGSVDVTDDWQWGSGGSGTASIGVAHNAAITIGGTWRGAYEGTGILDIADYADIHVYGDLRGGDAEDAWFEAYIGGDSTVTVAGDFYLGDDGSGLIDISSNASVECSYLMLKTRDAAATGSLDVSGNAGIVVYNNLVICEGEGAATMNMSGGTVEAANLYLAEDEGNATLNMTGGSITVSSELAVPTYPTGTAEINLYGGVIDCGSFTHAGPYSLDVAGGTLIIDGDVIAAIEDDYCLGYITAFGQGCGGRTDLMTDYDVINPGKTSVWAEFNLEKAWNPDPPCCAEDVPVSVVLSWSPGDGMDVLSRHHVYFGTDKAAVENAEVGDPEWLGWVPSSVTTYDIGVLAYSKTHYWRIDEFTALYGLIKGDVWSFTTGAAPSSSMADVTNPDWYITLDSAGFSDYLYLGVSPSHPWPYHELLSGEWSGGIYYDGVTNSGKDVTAPAGTTTWFTNHFSCPAWTTNSAFVEVQPITTWDDPSNPVIGDDTGQSIISNGQVQVQIDYEMVDLGYDGFSPMGVVADPATGRFVASGRYVMLQTYTVTNISDSALENVELYQMLHGHAADEYGPAVNSVYDSDDYGDPLAAYVPYNPVHTVGNFRYDITQWNNLADAVTADHVDYVGFSSAVEPDVIENGFYVGHSGKPAPPGTHWNIEGRTLNGLTSSYGEIAGAEGWRFETLELDASIAMTVALMPGIPDYRRFADNDVKWSQPPLETELVQHPNGWQMPTYCGWNELSSDDEPDIWQVVADDFRCLGTMPVSSVHWWGSYIGWISKMPPELVPTAWEIGFWSNVPTGAGASYSHPDELLFKLDIPTERVHWEWVGTDEFPGLLPEACFRYYLELQPGEYFWQDDFDTQDNIFWISIMASYSADQTVDNPWGWKTRPSPWMDDAVRFQLYQPVEVGTVVGPADVTPIEVEGESFDTAFELDTDPDFIKWDQPFTGIRSWPHYEDELSMAMDETAAFDITRLVADDWPCDQDTPITAVVWWGSYIGYGYGPCVEPWMPPPVPPDYFWLTIWDDVPVGGGVPYSHPNDIIWEYRAYDYDEVLVGYDKHPYGEPDEPVFRYSVRLPHDEWFLQDSNDGVYWFSVVAVYDDNVPNYDWGWTNHEHVYNDDAVEGYYDPPGGWFWSELYDQTQESEDMSFILFTDPAGHTCWDPLECAGQTTGDATCDGQVNLDDLAALKAAWGMSSAYANPYCCADFTQDGQVNLDDLAALKAGWGGSGLIPATGSQKCPP